MKFWLSEQDYKNKEKEKLSCMICLRRFLQNEPEESYRRGICENCIKKGEDFVLKLKKIQFPCRQVFCQSRLEWNTTIRQMIFYITEHILNPGNCDEATNFAWKKFIEKEKNEDIIHW